MKIDTKAVLLDFKNDPLLAGDEEISVGLALSNILVSATEGGKMKLYTLAQRAYKDKSLEIDEADLALLKRSVESTTFYSNIVTGQLLLILEGSSAAKDQG